MYKNIAIALLACVCLFLLYSWQAVKKSPISAADYGGLIALRGVISPEEYQNIVIPSLEKARNAGGMTRAELEELSGKLPSLGAQALETARKARPQEALAQALEETMRSAGDLGNDIGRGMRDALNELSRRLDDALRSGPKPDNNHSGQAPSRI